MPGLWGMDQLALQSRRKEAPAGAGGIGTRRFYLTAYPISAAHFADFVPSI